jgi:hypothetical protein
MHPLPKMILAHYHHRDDAPFQNLSALSEANALHVISTLRRRTGNLPDNKAINPAYIGLLCMVGVMPKMNDITQMIQIFFGLLNHAKT